MNHLLLAPELFGTNGGIPRILRLYLKALCDLAGPTDHVGFVALNDVTLGTSELRRYATERLGAWETCHRSKCRFIRATLRLSRTHQHLVCGHVAQLPVAWAARLLRPRLAYDLVAHGIEVWRPFSLAERLALRGARRILCVSAATRDAMQPYCLLPAERFVVLPNALDPFFPIATTVTPPAAPVIATVSRLSRADSYKGIDHLIQALPRIREAIPQARLQIMGQGDDLPRLTKLAREVGQAEAVEFLGFVSDMEMQNRLRACALFALPSQREGFGLVFLEAMAQGRPCLGARAGGIPEVITSESGILVEYGEVPGIAAAVIAALQRPWDAAVILAHVRTFSYSVFRDRLQSLLRA